MLPLLEGILAFSLTMLAVATAVSVVVELLLKALGVRREKLKDFLQQFYEEELRPTVETELARLGDKATSEAKAAVSGVARKVANEWGSVKGALPQPLLVSSDSAAEPKATTPTDECHKMRLTSLETQEMVERLRRSELGHELMNKLDGNAEAVFQKLGERYETFGNFFSEQFRGKMHFWSGTVAVVLALLVNIDSIQLLKTYMQDQEARAQVIAEQAQILEKYEARVNGGGTAPGQSGDVALTKGINEARNEMSALTSGPFPIGYQYYPYCADNEVDRRCRIGNSDLTVRFGLISLEVRTFGLFFTWIAGCLLTGAMAGLGGPFWYDAVSALLRSVQVLRSSQRVVAAAEQEAARKQNG